MRAICLTNSETKFAFLNEKLTYKKNEVFETTCCLPCKYIPHFTQYKIKPLSPCIKTSQPFQI